MKKTMTLIIAALSTLLMTESVYAGCTSKVEEYRTLDSGVRVIQQRTGNPAINIGTKFVSEEGATFRVINKNGELHVDSSNGKFPAEICADGTGLRARLFLSGLQKAFAGRDVVNVTIQGVGPNTVRIDSDLEKAEPTDFHPAE